MKHIRALTPLAVFIVGVCFFPSSGKAEPVAANVGSSEVTVFWESSEEKRPDVRVFLNSSATEEVTSELRREAFPLAGGSHPYREAAERDAQRSLQEAIGTRGLQVVRVSLLEPDQQYYVETGFRDEAGGWESTGDSLLAVQTATATGFVEEYRQVVINFQDDSAEGSVALLSVPGGRAPLLAVVGDESGGAGRAVFPLSAVLDDFTGEPLDPSGVWQFDVTHFPGDSAQAEMSESVAEEEEFRVGAVTTLTFEMVPGVEVAEFEFNWVQEEMAGQPFVISVTAVSETLEVVTDFSGTALIDSDGEIEGGSFVTTFEEGVAEETITFANTGEFVLTAWDEESGAEGESLPFTISTEWENWLALNVDPDELEDTLYDQRRADPDGRGYPMLMHYAFALDDTASGSVIEENVVEENGETYLSVSFPRLQSAPDVHYRVIGSDDLNAWDVVSVVEPGAPEWVTVQDNQPISANDQRFLRVELVAADTFEFWRTSAYGVSDLNDAAISGPDADPGDYGVSNLERYALGMSATNPNLSLLPSRRTVTVEGEDYYELSFSRLTRGEDVRYIVEATSDYPSWETISEFGPGEPAEQTVRDTTPVPDEGYRIIRLRIEPTY